MLRSEEVTSGPKSTLPRENKNEPGEAPPIPGVEAVPALWLSDPSAAKCWFQGAAQPP